MPLLIQTCDLQPGMRLAEAFLWRGRMMLPGGKVLTRDDAEILARKYPEIMLQVGDPVLDSIADFEDDKREREVAGTAQAMVAQSLSGVQERFASRTAAASVNFNAMRASAAAVIDYLANNPSSAALLKPANDPDQYLSQHSGNVFYLSIVLGSAVRDYLVRERQRQTSANRLSFQVSMDLLPMGLGAMFMDVGMFPLAHIFAADYALTPADRKAIRAHPHAGCEQLPDSLPPGVKMVVRTHHENFDGTGYPDAMPGPDQHIFTRIVRICDAYEAATAKKVYATAKSPARAIWEMSDGPMKKFYDPVLTKMFRSLIQPFAIGSKIKLNDGRTAVVVKYNRKEPFRPTVIVAFDEKGERLPKEALTPPVGVGEGNTLRLSEYAGEDLSFVYETAEQVAPARGQEPAKDVEKQADEKEGLEFGSLLEAAYP